MKKFFFFFLLSSVCIQLAAQDQKPAPKLSAATRMYLWKQAQLTPGANPVFPEYVYRLDAQQNVYVSAMIKVYPGFQSSVLEAIGARVGTKAGMIWTVQVPVDRMNEFCTMNGIQYIETDRPSAPDLDTARVMTRVDSVHGGYFLPQPFTGKDVVVGVIDAGFDYTHPTFYDTSYSNFRIKRVWEEKNLAGPGPAAFGYGTEFNDSASIITRQYDILDGTHGTHVAGIAAGSGAGGPGGNNSRYRGMAYESDIVMVGIYPSATYWLNTGMTDMLDGMNYIYSYAGSVGKPAVANLSWGCPLGPHDGSSLFSQACDALTGPGKIFVLSAGNNGANRIHFKKTFTPTDTAVKTNMTFSTNLPYKKNWVDAWGDTAQSFCMQFSLYSGTTQVALSSDICLDDTTHLIHLIGLNGDTCYITVTTVSSEFNMKPHMLVEFFSNAAEKVVITLKGTGGTVDMWQGIVIATSGYYGAFTTGGIPGCVIGDLVTNISDMATSNSALAVGAYNSKPTFTNVSNQTLSYSGYPKGNIASFSSRGPTADGRTKPNITGPGMALASSISSADTTFYPAGPDYNTVVSTYVSPMNGQTYSYAMLAGTSMSGPAVSGIVGLLLEADSSWTPAQVMAILAQTAIVDTYTGTIPANGSNTWGFGKVNAYAAIKEALNFSSIHHQATSTLNGIVYPNPGTGAYNIGFTSEKTQLMQLGVFDLTGREVKTQQWMSQQGSNVLPLDLSELPAGAYFIRVNSAEGVMTVKVVKE